jgi:hypothetical protein
MSVSFTNIAKISRPANDGAPSSRESSAFHEAGHAVIAVLLGVAVDAVELLPEGSNPCGKFRFGVVRRDQADLVVIVAKAGLLAELVFNPDAPRSPRRQDERIAMRACRGRLDTLFPASRARFMRGAELAALQLIGEYWPVISALARELLHKGKLSGAEAKDFVRQRISGDNSVLGEPKKDT